MFTVDEHAGKMNRNSGVGELAVPAWLITKRSQVQILPPLQYLTSAEVVKMKRLSEGTLSAADETLSTMYSIGR